MRICPQVAGNINISTWGGASSSYMVETPSRVLYRVYIDSLSDVAYTKSTDGGKTWGVSIIVHTGTVIYLTVWYDRWSDISAGLIHCAYVDNGVDDILYQSIDTENSDALSGETTVFAGSTAVASGSISITRARGGNIIVAGAIDAGAEDGAWESNNVGATWGGTIADPSEGGSGDQYLLLPDWNADTQDVMLIFWDSSADELSVKRYDNSADTWTEASIATLVDVYPGGQPGPQFAAAVDLTNSQNVIVAWSAVDLLNADLQCWKITNTTINEMTNVVLNSTDDQGICAIGIDTQSQAWWVAYAGKSDGSETWFSAVQVYVKVSVDAGSTWGAETLISTIGTFSIRQLIAVPRSIGPPAFNFALQGGTQYNLHAIVAGITPSASYQMGVM